jgi:hypothetical protein
VLYQKGEKNKMNNNLDNSKTIIKNIAKILENIEVDDVCVQQSIADIKDASNQLKKAETNYKNEDTTNNSYE